MTGLEKILEDIKKEADTESQKILKEAEAKASVIKQEAEKDAAETKKRARKSLPVIFRSSVNAMNPPPSSAGHR